VSRRSTLKRRAAYLYEIAAATSTIPAPPATLSRREDAFEVLRNHLETAGDLVNAILEHQKEHLCSDLDHGMSTYPWLDIIDDVRVEIAKGSQPISENWRETPFLNQLLPFLTIFRQRIALQSGSSVKNFSEPALSQMERHLLDRLSSVSSLSYYAILEQIRTENGESGCFQRFADLYRESLGDSVFSAFPVTARRLAQITLDTIDACSEMMKRFERDRLDISETLTHEAIGVVKSIELGLSDPHCGARSVAILRFDDRSVVYKPKPLGMDVAYASFIAIFNSGADSRLRCPIALDRGEYGWVEYIEHDHCRSLSEVEEYYFNFGSLIAVMYLLCASDFHYENVIASNTMPIPVDFETLFYPRRRIPKTSSSPIYSILESGLLPISTSVEGTSEVSAFGAFRLRSQFPILRFEGIGTDSMRILGFKGEAMVHHHLPNVDGIALTHDLRRASVVRGFERIYRWIANNRAEVTRALQVFRHQIVRFVPRPTQVYARLLQRLSRPRAAIDGVCAELETNYLLLALVDVKAKLSLTDSEVDRLATGAERRDLLRGDIPVFGTTSNSRSLQNNRKVIDSVFFEQTGWERVCERLAGFSDGALTFERRVLESSIDLMETDVAPQPLKRATTDLIVLANLLAKEIISARLLNADGHRVWISLGAGDKPDTVMLSETDGSVYQGAVGIAVFLSALYAVTGLERHRDEALAIVEDVESSYAERRDDAYVPLGLAGVGGWLVAASLMERLIGRGIHSHFASSLLDSLSEEMIRAHAGIDVMEGPAGLLLTMDSAGMQSRPGLRDLCVSSLVSSSKTNDGSVGWRTLPGESVLAGFAHGAAGIVLALERAQRLGSQVAGLAEALEIGQGVIEGAYDAKEFRWRDLRRQGGKSSLFSDSWCHGTAGVVLSGMYSKNVAFRSAAITAATRMTEDPLVSGDSLCCGVTGVADVLLEGARRLQIPALEDRARRILAAAIERWSASGRFCLAGSNRRPDRFPTLFQGAAGIGYMLLRITEPARIPSILAVQCALDS
jgi:type 2 lantibiotic biosynthesis protein LanM